MVNAKDLAFSQIKTFINKCSGKELEVYNSTFIKTSPKKINRIEYKLDNFSGIGHNYSKKDTSGYGYVLHVNSVYNCQLEIRVIDEPMKANEIITNIISGLNQPELRNLYMPCISVRPETIRNNRHFINENNTIYSFERLVVNISFMYDSSFDIDYFDTIETPKITIKEV